MGVDFLVCKNCEDTFCDCGEYVNCECGENWCSDECAEADGFKKEHCKLELHEEDCNLKIPCWKCENQIQSSCNYCRNEDFDDAVLLEFAMKRLGVDRERLIEVYKESL